MRVKILKLVRKYWNYEVNKTSGEVTITNRKTNETRTFDCLCVINPRVTVTG